MANFPGAMNILPGVWGIFPEQQIIKYKNTILTISRDNGIEVNGDWEEAGKGLFLEILKWNEGKTNSLKGYGYGSYSVFTLIKIYNGKFEIALDDSESNRNNEELIKNFLKLRQHYDAAKKMLVFW